MTMYALELPDETADALTRLRPEERTALDDALRGMASAAAALVNRSANDPYTELRESRATAMASEAAIARLWDTPEEDKAWEHL